MARERTSGLTESIEAPLREIADELAAPRRLDDQGSRRGLRLDGPGMSAGTGRRDAELRMGEEAETAEPVKENEAVAVGAGDDAGPDASGGSKA